MKRNNALSQLGRALTQYLKAVPAKDDKGKSPKQRNIPATRSHRKPSREYQEYSEKHQRTA